MVKFDMGSKPNVKEESILRELQDKFAFEHKTKILQLDSNSVWGSASVPEKLQQPHRWRFRARVVDSGQAPAVHEEIVGEATVTSPPICEEDKLIYPQQWLVARELAERIRQIYGMSWHELHETRFSRVDFVIFTGRPSGLQPTQAHRHSCASL